MLEAQNFSGREFWKLYKSYQNQGHLTTNLN